MADDDLPRDDLSRLDPQWRWWVGTLAGAFLGAVLVVALFPKANDPYAFQKVIETQGLDFLFSSRVVAFIGLAAEAVLGFALLFGIRHRWVLWPSVALVAFFLFLTGRHYYLHEQGLVADDDSCGCFGDLITRTPAEAFWQDLILLVPTLLFSFVGRPDPKDPQPWRRIALVAGLSLGVLIYTATREPAAPLLAPDANPAEMCVGEGEGEDGRLCFDAVIPELADEGSDHLIVLTEVDDPAFLERLAAFGDYADAFQGPALWVVAPIGDEALEAFQFEHQPAFEVLACPRVLVEAMDGALPAAFRVRDGRVTTIWENWPPLDELQAEAADDPGEDAGDGSDDGSEPGDNAGDSDSVDPDNADDSPVDDGAEDGGGAPHDGAGDDDSGGGFRDEDDR